MIGIKLENQKNIAIFMTVLRASEVVWTIFVESTVRCFEEIFSSKKHTIFFSKIYYQLKDWWSKLITVDHPRDGDSASNAINCHSQGQSTASSGPVIDLAGVESARIFGKTRSTLKTSRNHDVKQSWKLQNTQIWLLEVKSDFWNWLPTISIVALNIIL